MRSPQIAPSPLNPWGDWGEMSDFSDFLGSGPGRGRSPVEWRDFPSVCPSVRPWREIFSQLFIFVLLKDDLSL